MHQALLAIVATWIGVSGLASGRVAADAETRGAERPASSAPAAAGAACTPGDYKPCLCPHRDASGKYEAYDGKLVCSDDGATWSSCMCR